MSFRKWLWVSALGMWLAPLAADATMMVTPMTVDEVTAESRQVVHGIVTDVASGRDESGVPSTWTTLAVVEVLKGAPERTLTIKQYGVAAPLEDGTLTRIVGLPTYQVGEEVVLFLRGASRRGFTSPVGLGQGTYRVRRSAGKQPEVRADDQRGGVQDLATLVGHVKGAVAR